MVLKANLVLGARPEPVDETISQKRQLLSATSNSQIAKRASYIQKEEETSNYSSAPEATVVDSLPSPQACSSALRYYSCCKYYKYYYLRCSLPSPSLLFCLLQLQLPQILLLLAKPHSLPSRGLLLWKTVCHLVANAPRSFRLSLLLLLLLLLLLRHLFTTTTTNIATTTGNASFIAKTSWQGSSLVQLVADRRNPGRESRGV